MGTGNPVGSDGYRFVTAEDIATLQGMMNGLESMWNAMLDAAGGVRGRAIDLGFAPEVADQIGLLAFSNVLETSTHTPTQ